MTAGDPPDVTVLVVDDDALVRSGLRAVLAVPGIRVVGEADDGATALAECRRLSPDVVLMDVAMPGTDGIAATAALRSWPAPPQVLVLTALDVDGRVVEALRAGAAGFLLKDTPPDRIVEAVGVVARGDALISAAAARDLAAHLGADGARAAEARRALGTLTPRELDVARSVARGGSTADVSRELHLAESTVKAYLSSVMAKLGASNRVQVAIAVHDAEH